MKRHLAKPPRHNLDRTAALYSVIFFIVFISAGVVTQSALTSETSTISTRAAASARARRPIPEPSATPVSTGSTPSSAMRIIMPLGNRTELPIATGADSLIVVSPEIAGAALKNRFNAIITALSVGETMLIAKYGEKRHTYIVEVVGKKQSDAKGDASAARIKLPEQPSAATGTLTTTFVSGSGDGDLGIRQGVDIRKKLSGNRTLRINGDTVHRFRAAPRGLESSRLNGLDLNRVSLGIDTLGQSVDLLDSQVSLSPMTLNGYTLRGLHIVRQPKGFNEGNLDNKGLDIFAGVGRLSPAFFDSDASKVAGAMIPVLGKQSFQARAGFIAVSDAGRNPAARRGGVALQADAAYALTTEISGSGEMSFAHGDLSWRARLDVRNPNYGGSTQITRLATRSPLIFTGAQPGGRENEAVSFYWRPPSRLSVSAGYDRTLIKRSTSSQPNEYERFNAFASVSLRFNKDSRLSLRLADQSVDTTPGSGFLRFKMDTRSLSATHSARFNGHFSNVVEARLNLSQEELTGQATETGFSFREQLRASWSGTAIAASVAYSRKTPSLLGVVLRSPQILPPELQRSLQLNPAIFLDTNRDRIAFLLNGLELPLNRNLEMRAGFRKAVSRFTASADVRYADGEVSTMRQKTFSATASLNINLDKANLILLTGWKSTGMSDTSGLSISYTHQFGRSGDGFQFSKLLGSGAAKSADACFRT